jgi:hypothetical protein
VLLGLAGVLYAVASNKGNSTSHASSTPSPAAGVHHGSKVYDAPFSAAAWGSGNIPSPDPSAAALSVGYSATSIDFKILKNDASVNAQFDAPGLKNYVSNLVFQVDAGSDMEFDWDLRNEPSGPGNIFLSFDVTNESMTLWLSPIDGTDNKALSAGIDVPKMQAGATVDVWMVVNGDNIKVFLGTQKVVDVNESTVTGAATPNLYLQGKANAVLHLLAVKYYTVS